MVSERLGHASIGITLDTYSHVLPGLQEAAAEKFDSFLMGMLVIQNTGYLTLNHAVIISTCHANNSGPDPHYHSDVCTVILTTKTVASGAINLGRHMAGRREQGSGEKTGKPKS
jgi:hypothetical protein